MPTILDTLAIATCTISYGKESSFAGKLANVGIRVTAKAAGVDQLRLNWAATGDMFTSFDDFTSGDSGAPGIIVLPQTGQTGFRHGTTAFKDWYYEAVVTGTLADGQTRSRTYRFQIPAGQTTLDLDTLDEDGNVALATQAPIAAEPSGLSDATRASLAATYPTFDEVALALGAFELQPYQPRGDSWTASAVHSTATARTTDRVASRLRVASQTNRGVSSRTMLDVANLALGGVHGWTPRTKAFVTMSSLMLNDLVQNGSSAIAQTVYTRALRALLCTLTSNAAIASNTAAFSYSAGWAKESLPAFTDPTSASYPTAAGATVNHTGTARMTTSTVGSYALAAVASDAVDIFLVARTSEAGLATVTDNTTGTVLGTLDLATAAPQEVVQPLRLTGLGSTARTLRITLTSGASLTIDSIRVPLPAANQVPIVLAPAPNVPTGGTGNTLPAGDPAASYQAAQVTLRAVVATVAAEFPSVSIADLQAAEFLDAHFDSDKRHLNDRGCTLAATVISRALMGYAYTQGLNVLNSAGDAPVYSSPTPPAVPSGGQAGDALPSAPTSLLATPDDTTMALTWAAPRDTSSSPITGYAYRYRIGTGTYTTGTTASPTVTVSGLTNATTYEFGVAAVNANGTSSYATTTAAPAATPVVALGDTFEASSSRPVSSSSLGSTDTGATRAWTQVGGCTWGINISGYAYASGGSAVGAAYVNCGSPDGSVSHTIAAIDATYNGGVSGRVTDASNMLIASWRQNTTTFFYTLFKRIAGATTQIATSTRTPVVGDIVTLSMSGSTILLKVNGTTVVTATNTDVPSAKNHGLYASGGTTSRFDQFAYSPTP